MSVSIIVAASKNGVIGSGGTMPWGDKPIDGSYFSRMTLGCTLIMGRKTFESLPLDSIFDRNIVVVSSSLCENDKQRTLLRNVRTGLNVYAAVGLDEALLLADEVASASGRKNIMIAGGGQVYEEALSKINVDYVYVTETDVYYHGDTTFNINKSHHKNAFYLLGETKDVGLTYKAYANCKKVDLRDISLEDYHHLRNFKFIRSVDSELRKNLISALFKPRLAVAIDESYYYCNTPIVELEGGKCLPLSVRHHHPLYTFPDVEAYFFSEFNEERVNASKGLLIHIPIAEATGLPLVKFKLDEEEGVVRYAGRRPFTDTDWISIYISTFNVSFN